MSDVILSFEDITVRSMGQTAVDNISFEIKRGEHWALVGDNETGTPELFQYFPGGVSCSDVIESGFYGSLGLFQDSDAAKQTVALRWMRIFGIAELAAKPFKNVPTSSQRLCLLARALVKNPVLLILDEPCHGFDASQQRHFKSLINAVCEASNMTLIYVSHYQHEIPECVTRMIQLENGRCVSLVSGGDSEN